MWRETGKSRGKGNNDQDILFEKKNNLLSVKGTNRKMFLKSI